MSDDALIETMLDEYIGKIRNTFSGGQHEVCRNKMRAALAVARKEILEEAAQMVERSYEGACYEGISRFIAADIRSLAEQEHTP